MSAPSRELRLILRFLCVALAVICLTQLYVSRTKEAPPSYDDSYDDDEENVGWVAAGGDRNVSKALSAMTLLKDDLTSIQVGIEHLAETFNTSMLPAVQKIQMQLKEMGVPPTDLDKLQGLLKPKIQRIYKAADDVRDDLESMVIKVRFILTDLRQEMRNVVPSAVEYLKQFRTELDHGYKNSRNAMELAALATNKAILNLLQGRSGTEVDEIRAMLTILAGDLKEEKLTIDEAWTRYGKSKESAVIELKRLVES